MFLGNMMTMYAKATEFSKCVVRFWDIIKETIKVLPSDGYTYFNVWK